MIDICFSDTVAGTLLQIKKDIHSEGVLPLDLHLNYEYIDCDIAKAQAKRNIDTLKYFYKTVTDEELKKEYTKELRSIRSGIKRVEEFLTKGQPIRLWLSNNANDRCGLYWFCHFAKNYSNEISVVICPGYEYSHRTHTAYVQNGWGAFSNPYFVAQFASTAHVLDEHEKAAYVREWSLLVKENAPLRILIDNVVVGVEESFFDSIILSFTKFEPHSQRSIMGNMLGKWQGCCDVAFISMRIERLISEDKIKVCEEKVDDHDCYWPRTIALV